MKKITLSHIVHWMSTPNEDPQRIINLKTDLLKQIPSSCHNHPTIRYVFNTLDTVIRCNTEISTFAHKWNIAPLLPAFFTNTARDALNKEIERTLGQVMLQVNTNKIDINCEESKHAAEALAKLFKIHIAQFADPESKDDDYYPIMNDKLIEITTRITAYETTLLQEEKAAEETGRHEAQKSYFGLNQHITTECKKIKAINKQSTRIQLYQSLNDFVSEAIKKDTADWDAQQYVPLLDAIDKLTEKLNQEKKSLQNNQVSVEQRNEILQRFDRLSCVFSKKITQLKNRHKRLEIQEHDNYTQVIIDADRLVEELTTARNVFEENLDLLTFTQTTRELFNRFQNMESFNTNRSNPWFRTFISKPFEQLKLFINQITAFLYKIICGKPSDTGSYKGTLFAQPETDTTKKLKAFHQGVEDLVSPLQRTTPVL